MVTRADDLGFKYIDEEFVSDIVMPLKNLFNEHRHFLLRNLVSKPEPNKACVNEIFLGARLLPIAKDAEDEPWLALYPSELVRNLPCDIALPFFVEVHCLQSFAPY